MSQVLDIINAKAGTIFNSITINVAVDKDAWIKKGDCYVRGGAILEWRESVEGMLVSSEKGGKIIRAEAGTGLLIPELVMPDTEITPEFIEALAKKELDEIHKVTTLCINEDEEHIFLCGINAGHKAAQSKGVFSEKDMFNCFRAGKALYNGSWIDDPVGIATFNKYIKCLKPTPNQLIIHDDGKEEWIW